MYRVNSCGIRQRSAFLTLAAIVFSALLLTACGGGGGGDAAPAAASVPNPSPPSAPPAPGNGAATLSWQPPTMYSDNSPLTIAGYKFYGGTSQSNMTLLDDVTNPGIATHMLTGLQTGTTWFFAVTAYDAQGVESIFSNVASKTL